MARVEPESVLPSPCPGAFHLRGAEYLYDKNCERCVRTYGSPVDLTKPKEVKAWLDRTT